MDDNDLQQLVEEISETFFKLSFKHRASFNYRLRTTGGRYLLGSHNIEVNPKQMEHFGNNALIGIIKHELCHYHLHIQKKGYQHRDKDFQQLLLEVGGTKYCELIPGQRRTSKTHHVYGCTTCNAIFNRKRTINTKRFVCGKCKGKIRKLDTYKKS